jgi:hypothetical protein
MYVAARRATTLVGGAMSNSTSTEAGIRTTPASLLARASLRASA